MRVKCIGSSLFKDVRMTEWLAEGVTKRNVNQLLTHLSLFRDSSGPSSTRSKQHWDWKWGGMRRNILFVNNSKSTSSRAFASGENNDNLDNVIRGLVWALKLMMVTSRSAKKLIFWRQMAIMGRFLFSSSTTTTSSSLWWWSLVPSSVYPITIWLMARSTAICQWINNIDRAWLETDWDSHTTHEARVYVHSVEHSVLFWVHYL